MPMRARVRAGDPSRDLNSGLSWDSPASPQEDIQPNAAAMDSPKSLDRNPGSLEPGIALGAGKCESLAPCMRIHPSVSIRLTGMGPQWLQASGRPIRAALAFAGTDRARPQTNAGAG